MRTSIDPVAVALADLDRDGRLDVASASRAGDCVSVLYGLGDGTLGERRDYGAGDQPVAVAAGDVDENGWLDLVVANQGSSTAQVLRNRGGEGFEPRRGAVAVATPRPGRLQVVPRGPGAGMEVRWEIGPAPVPVQLAIYDVAGRRLLMHASGVYPPGRFASAWDGRDAAGAELGRGVYFLRLQAGRSATARKFVLRP